MGLVFLDLIFLYKTELVMAPSKVVQSQSYARILNLTYIQFYFVKSTGSYCTKIAANDVVRSFRENEILITFC